jgi:hypothetical protein
MNKRIIGISAILVTLLLGGISGAAGINLSVHNYSQYTEAGYGSQWNISGVTPFHQINTHNGQDGRKEMTG